MRPYRIFFSHGGDDTFIVKEFLKPKVVGSGATVFLDSGQLAYGDDFRQIILTELALNVIDLHKVKSINPLNLRFR